MSWPIPEVPDLPLVAKPKFKAWFGFLVFLIVLYSVVFYLFYNTVERYQLLFYVVLPPFFIWAALFGFVLYRYEHYLTSSAIWATESEHTFYLWQNWSKWHQAVIGNVFLSPEQDEIASLFGDEKDIPMFPCKPRPLFGEVKELFERLSDVDVTLEKQLPGYRDHLNRIYLLCSHSLCSESIVDNIFQKWFLQPSLLTTETAEEVFSDANEGCGVTLLICVDCWPRGTAQESSEFLTAQLITSLEYVTRYNLPVIAALGRAMRLDKDELSKGLDMLFQYNQLSYAEIQHVWLGGSSSETTEELIVYAAENDWPLPSRRPVNLIDLSFGPPSAILFFTSLALMVKAVTHTENEQLLICFDKLGSGLLCLV